MTDSTPTKKLTPRNIVLAIVQILVMGLAAYFGYETGCDHGEACKGGNCPVVVPAEVLEAQDRSTTT